MQYALLIAFVACFVGPFLWTLFRHVVLVSRQRKPAAVRQPQPFIYGSKL
jgi:hypothetical protein